MEKINLKIIDQEFYREEDKIFIKINFVNEYGTELFFSGSTEIETKKGYTGYYYGN